MQPLRSSDECLVEWYPRRVDGNKGLNHQMAALSCALAEAFYLKRHLVVPDTICMPDVHSSRWGNQHRCALIDSLFDLDALAAIVPVARMSALERYHYSSDEVSITSTASVHTAELALDGNYTCAKKPLLRRRNIMRFWFANCVRGFTNDEALMSHLQALFRLPEPPSRNTLLRSGLFFARRIKQAAAAVVDSLLTRGPFAVLHLRRSDRLTQCDKRGKHACKLRFDLTRPASVRKALRQWLPRNRTVYLSCSDRCADMRVLADEFVIVSPENFQNELSGIDNNHALYATEQLISTAADVYIETFQFQAASFFNGCWPAHAADVRGLPFRSTKTSRGHVIAGVRFGAACQHNAPCGRDRTHLVPSSNCTA